MTPHRKFSTSIVLFLIVFTSVSLVSITSVGYFLHRQNTRKDYLAGAESGKQGMVNLLKNNMEFMVIFAGEVSTDPLVQSHLRNGDYDALINYFAKQTFLAIGVSVTIYDSKTGRYVPDLLQEYPGLESYLEESTQPEPGKIKFHQLGGNILSIFSSEIMEGSSVVGTCFVVYDFTKDRRFHEFSKTLGVKYSRIVYHDGGENLIDVETGERLSLRSEIEAPDDPEKRIPITSDILPGEVILPIDDFPGLFFAVDLSSLIQGNKSFLIALVSIGIAVFCIICIASVWLSKMVTKPLKILATETFETAKAPADRLLREDRAGYIEFYQIARAFNQILETLLYLQRKFKQKAKQELDTSEERYRLTLEAAPDCITINSLVDGRFIQVNEAFVKVTGYSREEVIGKSNDELNLFADPSQLERMIEKARQKGGVNGMEVKHRRKDGTIIDSVMSARTMDFENEACLISVVSDRTEQKKLEVALQRATKMEAIGTMAGGVAHDLNNILSGIVSYPDLLLMDLPEDSPMRPAVLTIQKSGQRAAAIVQDMLTLARRGVPVTEVVDVNHAVQEYLKSPEHQSLLKLNPAVRVQVELGADLLNVIGSDVHIAKSLMNLVSNAIEAMPEGGNLRICTRNQYVDKPVKRYDTVNEGDYVVLEVSDSGTGVSPEDQERIFEPFYTKKKMGRSGTGLGMAVVWGTVKDHSGYIDLESKKGVGTTFQLYFPATRSSFVKDKPEILQDMYLGKDESVLVVDDVAEQRSIASAILKRLGYEAAAVASGEEALEYLQENKVDLLVLDMVMEPGMDGLDTFREILVHFPGQRVVIASGFSETDRVREAQRLGAGAYVRKPYLMQNIGIAVREELDRQ